MRSTDCEGNIVLNYLYSIPFLTESLAIYMASSKIILQIKKYERKSAKKRNQEELGIQRFEQ